MAWDWASSERGVWSGGWPRGAARGSSTGTHWYDVDSRDWKFGIKFRDEKAQGGLDQVSVKSPIDDVKRKS
jgi:hypothetical protein